LSSSSLPWPWLGPFPTKQGVCMRTFICTIINTQNRTHVYLFLVPVSGHLQLPFLCPNSPQPSHCVCLVALPVLSKHDGILFFLCLPSPLFLPIGGRHMKSFWNIGH
jgi:hypothetical protein